MLLSEIVDLDGRNFLRAHPSLPLFLATAEDDSDPGVSDLMQWLSTFSTNTHTKSVRYKTGGHGVEMFAAQPVLPACIVDWVIIAVRSPNVATAQGPPNVPRENAVSRLARPARRRGQLCAALCRSLWQKSEWPGGFRVGPHNRLGRDHLQDGDKKGTIAILKLNASLYPNSPNVYDSLGDAYLAGGQDDLARQNAQKAIELLVHDTTDPEDRRKGIRDSAEQKLKEMFHFAEDGRNIPLLRRVPMKHLVGIGALVAMAFVLRFWLHTGLGLDITIHDTYRVVSSFGV